MVHVFRAGQAQNVRPALARDKVKDLLLTIMLLSNLFDAPISLVGLFF